MTTTLILTVLLAFTPIPEDARCEHNGTAGVWDISGTVCVTPTVYADQYGNQDISYTGTDGLTFTDYLNTPTAPPPTPPGRTVTPTNIQIRIVPCDTDGATEQPSGWCWT